jgi:predicted membrane protein
MARERGGEISVQLVMGLFIIALGMLFFLDRLDILEARAYLRYWPVVLIAVGIAQLPRARSGIGLATSLFWIIVGGWLLLGNLRLITLTFRDAWPALLIVVGGLLVWQAVSGRTGRAEDATSDSTVNATALLAGLHRTANARDFRGGKLTAVMGGCEIDLRQAAIPGGEAVIDTFAFWGGVEIRVPDTWTVVGKVMPVLGGFEDKTQPPAGGAPSPRLIVRGLAIMSGVEVKN